MRRAVTVTVFVALVALSAGAALANLPDPGTTTFDDCLGRSPKNASASNQYTFSGILRDATSAPVDGVPADQVVLEIKAPCANPVLLNPIGPSGPGGLVLWDAGTLNQGGGSCAGAGVVDIRVQGLSFKTLDDVRSPDEDGDGLVALGDLAVYQQAFVNQTPIFEGDLDCDGNIALSDLVLFQNHFTAP